MTANQNELIISSLFKVMIIFRKTRSLPFILRKSACNETGITAPLLMVGETLAVFMMPQIRKTGQCLDGQYFADYCITTSRYSLHLGSCAIITEGSTMPCYMFRSNHFGALSLVIPSFLLMKNMNGEKWLLNILNINQYLIVSWAVDFNLQIKYWFFAIWKEKWKSLKYATLFGPNIGTFQNNPIMWPNIWSRLWSISYESLQMDHNLLVLTGKTWNKIKRRNRNARFSMLCRNMCLYKPALCHWWLWC